MTYVEDLSSCEMFAHPDAPEQILAVGWLERGHAYQQGPVREEVVDALITLFVNPWQQPIAVNETQECSFCRLSKGRDALARIYQKGSMLPISIGGPYLFVPSHRCVYVAPAMILHYIDAHEYEPPQPFCQAFLACPPMRSVPYFRTLLSTDGGRSLVKLSRL